MSTLNNWYKTQLCLFSPTNISAKVFFFVFLFLEVPRKKSVGELGSGAAEHLCPSVESIDRVFAGSVNGLYTGAEMFCPSVESIDRVFAGSHHLLGSLWAPPTPTPTESHRSVLAKTWFRPYRPKPFKHKGSAQRGWF